MLAYGLVGALLLLFFPQLPVAWLVGALAGAAVFLLVVSPVASLAMLAALPAVLLRERGRLAMPFLGALWMAFLPLLTVKADGDILAPYLLAAAAVLAETQARGWPFAGIWVAMVFATVVLQDYILLLPLFLVAGLWVQRGRWRLSEAAVLSFWVTILGVAANELSYWLTRP